MKEQVINQIIQRMCPSLNNAQLKKLQEVLAITTAGVDMVNSEKSAEPSVTNDFLLEAFLAAKRVEGCSEKTLAYYGSTIQSMLCVVDKNIAEIDTNDLRHYLTDYQNKGSSRVTIDNIRRILSSFFTWLEDEDYILKSPVRRIHKVKAASTVKDTYSDEDLEKINFGNNVSLISDSRIFSS